MPDRSTADDGAGALDIALRTVTAFDADELNGLFSWYPGALIHTPLNGFEAISLSLEAVNLQDLFFYELNLVSDLHTAVQEDSQIVNIFVPVRGHLEADIYDRTVRTATEAGVIDSGFGVKSYRRTQGRCHRVFAIPRNRLAQAIVSHTGRPACGAIRFEPVFRMDANPGAMIGALAATFHQGTVLSDLITRSPLLGANLREALFELILVNLAHDHSHLYRGRAPRAASWQVKRAREFIETHASQPLTVERIAEACQLSVRTLYATFRDQLGTTPKLYLRGVRLAGARGELVDLASTATVAEIARRWGFLNLGLFAKQYRAAFGELPLRSRQARRRSPQRDAGGDAGGDA